MNWKNTIKNVLKAKEKKNNNIKLLYTQPININGYVPLLINMLDIILRRWKYTK